jgi:hypothetical protein
MESPLKEFTYRRRIALKGDEKEVTGRLIGFLIWMESVRSISTLLENLRGERGATLLDEALIRKDESIRNFDPVMPPDARTIEQIASVGLASVEEARTQNRNIFELAEDFGVENGSRSSESLIGRYVVPFLDYVEQRLPVPERELRGIGGAPLPPAIIRDSLSRFRAQHRGAASTCFVMMRFGTTSVHSRVEKTIKTSLKRHGLVGVLARDREFHDDLYPNIQTYVHGCGFGIAVFERLETNEFNPNVALEVGYMFGLRKQVLLLKDKTLPALHTDLVGKLYKEFDPQNPEDTIPAMIDSWLSDKGLA